MTLIIKRDTPADLFNQVLRLVKKNGHYDKVKAIMDYVLPINYRGRELTNYEFDFIAKVNWGGSEGIYLDCYIEGSFDDSNVKRLPVGIFKTLDTDITAFKIMGELAGAMTYYARVYVNSNFNRYEKGA